MSYAQSAGVSHSATAARALTSDWIDLGPLDDLPEGRPALRTGKGRSVAVPLAAVRRGARVDVFVAACSHLAGPLDEGTVEEVRGAACLVCPRHGSAFDLDDRRRRGAGRRRTRRRSSRCAWRRAGCMARARAATPVSAAGALGSGAMRRTAVALAAVAAGRLRRLARPRRRRTPRRRRASRRPSVPAVPGIEAEIVRLRTDEAIGGQVQVRVTDTGDAPFTVTAGGAAARPASSPEPPTATTADFAPGRVIDLPVPYGGAGLRRGAGAGGRAS